MAEDRTPRFSPEQRRAIKERHRQRAAAAKWGQGDYWSQGLRDEKEMGKAYLAMQQAKQQGGPFNPRTWDQQWRGGELWLRARPGQAGRIAQHGSDWVKASQVLSPGHLAAIMRTNLNSPTASAQAQRRGQFFEQNPEADMSHWLARRNVQNRPIDPATGLRRLPSGELRDEFGQMPGGPQFRSVRTGRPLFGAPPSPMSPPPPGPGPEEPEEPEVGPPEAPPPVPHPLPPGIRAPTFGPDRDPGMSPDLGPSSLRPPLGGPFQPRPELDPGRPMPPFQPPVPGLRPELRPTPWAPPSGPFRQPEQYPQVTLGNLAKGALNPRRRRRPAGAY